MKLDLGYLSRRCYTLTISIQQRVNAPSKVTFRFEFTGRAGHRRTYEASTIRTRVRADNETIKNAPFYGLKAYRQSSVNAVL